MKFSKELIFIILVLASLMAVNIYINRSRKISPNSRGGEYTSYNTDKNGAKALYLLLKKLDYKVKRLRMPHYTELHSAGMTILLAPKPSSISKADGDSLLEWVRDGNCLIFAPVEENSYFAGLLGLQIHNGKQMETSIAPYAYTELTKGIQRLVIMSNNRILTKRPDNVEHFGDEAGGIVITIKEGKGVVIVLSDPYILTNSGLPQGDNLDFLVNILLTYADSSKTVYLDEYHHGIVAQPNIFQLLKGTPLGWAILQAIFGVILLLYSRGRRFGSPMPVVKESYRSSMEYVDSLARMYQSAGASDLALFNICERLAKSSKSFTSSDEINQLIEECRAKIKNGKISDRELVDISRRIELAKHPGEGEQVGSKRG